MLSIYDASVKYADTGTALCILAGKEYGSGSSRDWAAKGPYLQGIRFVIAQSFERIHRSNLIGMGILPLQFETGQSVDSLSLTGREFFQVKGIEESISEGRQDDRRVTVTARDEKGAEKRFQAIVRLDTPLEVLYYRHGGILQYVLRSLLNAGEQGTLRAGALISQAGAIEQKEGEADRKVDEDSALSFPASDPPAY
jgi:aconitate hydratase